MTPHREIITRGRERNRVPWIKYDYCCIGDSIDSDQYSIRAPATFFYPHRPLPSFTLSLPPSFSHHLSIPGVSLRVKGIARGGINQEILRKQARFADLFEINLSGTETPLSLLRKSHPLSFNPFTHSLSFLHPQTQRVRANQIPLLLKELTISSLFLFTIEETSLGLQVSWAFRPETNFV